VATNYPGTLVDDTTAQLDVVELAPPGTQAWSVRVPLWTVEEGRSDLQLLLTVAMVGGSPSVEIDDFLVP